METTFPFGLSGTTQFYMALYVVTLAIHVFLMTYVLAGSAVMAFAVIFPGEGEQPRTSQPLLTVLRDWSPFVLSGAITAAVAPLLFVQILYPRYFYTANLLLGWRWMVVIPVLILAFYLLYLIKSKMASKWNAVARTALVVSACGCFLFVAFCWTANHLLSISPGSWTSAYMSGRTIESYFAVATRLSTWVSGAFPTMSVLAAWQLAYRKPASEAEDDALALEPKRLAYIAVSGLIAAVLFSMLYLIAMGPVSRGAVLGAPGRVWVGLLGMGIVAQAAVWWVQRKEEDFRLVYLAIIAGGSVLTLLATASLREVIRLSQVDHTLVATTTGSAAKVDGFWVFVAFVVMNFGLIGYCVWLVRTKLLPTPDSPVTREDRPAGNAPGERG